ncbi:MAG: cysteine desulfurase NifS [Deltaproteobacteria bacterium]|nr:cysteine desulfurase NifS [Deltaproteobacteria bacterium]
MRRVYLDHNATTPIHPEVGAAMQHYIQEVWGNPSSIHWAGRDARTGLEEARERVAALLNADPDEVIFTSSGTEADNLALKGVAYARRDRGDHIITTSVEHPAVIETGQALEKEGFRVTWLRVDRQGMVDLDDLRRAITPKTILISVMTANNETGVLFPIQEIGELARERGILFHTDAVQAVGKLLLDVKALPVDLLSLSAHKIYAPKGVGALYIRRGLKLRPLIHGGHQEKSRRAGTENMVGIVALGKAAELARQDLEGEAAHLEKLRDRLYEGIVKVIDGLHLNGHPEHRLPSTLNVSFEHVEGESLLLSLDLEGVAVSTGSACSAGTLEPSHVLVAMGLSPEIARGAIRFSLGKWNTAEDVDYVLDLLPSIVKRLRLLSPFYQPAPLPKA